MIMQHCLLHSSPTPRRSHIDAAGIVSKILLDDECCQLYLVIARNEHIAWMMTCLLQTQRRKLHDKGPLKVGLYHGNVNEVKQMWWI